MATAQDEIDDFQLICNPDQTSFRPADAVALHESFKGKLLHWFGRDLTGPRVVITHTAPVINPNTRHRGSPVQAAFNSLDMVEVIERHQPTLRVSGHTHECDDQTIGKTRIISNQLGYPTDSKGFECKDFDEAGFPIDINV